MVHCTPLSKIQQKFQSLYIPHITHEHQSRNYLLFPWIRFSFSLSFFSIFFYPHHHFKDKLRTTLQNNNMMEAIFLNQKTKAFVEEKKVTVKRSCRVFERKKKEVFFGKIFYIWSYCSKSDGLLSDLILSIFKDLNLIWNLNQYHRKNSKYMN